ncbi:MAG TPA: hypothetical protein VJH37_00055 [Candidatus Nanoarchaeia archaeon]|nr:hypothetical protein [Candidatus Nanoarchaeia archaeon]
MLSKKGEIEMQYVILLILALIALFVLIMMFRQQITHFIDTVFSITKEVNQSRPPIKDILGT